MELVYSPSNTYLVERVLYMSHKCRVCIASDRDGVRFTLNQICDRRLIKSVLGSIDASFSDFAECFIDRDAYIAVFKLHTGRPVAEAASANDPAALLECCVGVCREVLMQELPDKFLSQVIAPDCMVVMDKEVRINKLLTFSGSEPEEPRLRLASLLRGIISEAGLDPVQARTLAPLELRLKDPPRDLISIYLAVKDFQKVYTPMTTAELLKSKRKKAKKLAAAAVEKAAFAAAVAAMLIAAVLVVWNILRPENLTDAVFPKIGGYTLNERGSIDETVFSFSRDIAEEPETD